jgi:hypothetical protein
MALNFDNPLYSLSSKEANDRAKALWDKEDLGGTLTDNNRTPVLVVGLILFTVVTAFLLTFPLWGQRPNAAHYVEFVKAMNTPEIMAIEDDVEAMKKIVAMTKGKQQESKWDYDALRERHPMTMDEMRMVKPQIEALMAAKVDLEDYNIVGNRVVLANFEGNLRADGKPENRERKQPWWDRGYTIDVFYVITFLIGVSIVIKALPSYKWQPKRQD